MHQLVQPGDAEADQPQREIERDSAEEKGVEPVENAAVATERVSRIFNSCITFDRAFDKVTRLRCNRR